MIFNSNNLKTIMSTLKNKNIKIMKHMKMYLAKYHMFPALATRFKKPNL